MLPSQKSRKKNPEFDPLLLGAGWTVEDLNKPQILLESTAGDSHPGSRHLGQLVAEARTGVYKSGGKPAVYTVTDICDGVASGHAGIPGQLSANSRSALRNGKALTKSPMACWGCSPKWQEKPRVELRCWENRKRFKGMDSYLMNE